MTPDAPVRDYPAARSTLSEALRAEMRIGDYVRPELVLIGLEAEGVADAIHALVEPLAAIVPVSDPAALEQALLAREAAHSTALDRGVAVPHTTLADIDRSVIVVGVARDGVPFGSDEAPPVRLFFLLVSPPERTALHIKLLARLARLVRRERFVEELIAARSADELVARLENAESESA